MSEYQHPLNIKQLEDTTPHQEDESGAIEKIKEPTDWQIIIQIAGMALAAVSFFFGAVSNVTDTSLPLFSQLIYTFSGFACLLAMWIFWVHENKKLFWLAIIATFLIMYGA